MMAEYDTSSTAQGSKIPPQRFALYLAMGSVMMMFGAFTSAYLVRKGAGNWLEFTLPSIFYVSTAVLLISSVFLHMSYRGYKQQNQIFYIGGLVLSLVFGLAFLVLQYFGWIDLFNAGVDLKGNPSGSFLYVITFVHAAHVIGGVAALIVALLHALTLPFEYKEFRRKRFNIVVQYWHFVDILWVYLLGFLLLS